ncbi:hypothetical protein I553_8877 [Mycobacterium xenopi 4042]|uniref:Uncharacterized protein n=1 Tax=Mycobacterium xenopi 4042 TaxID=1299334 RepID=X8CN12_MYCXE|nr:hypothetical protein I552_8528 [Mycobacterium xenopi 3993]EUA56823.1 hypothetical protein I553_8877 [Mycobacterium xenopi 4042]
MPAAPQFTTNSDAGLHIAATSVAGQHKFHRGSWPLTFVAGSAGQKHNPSDRFIDVESEIFA